MNLILDSISFSYPSSPQEIFSRVSCVFPPGWTAVVGPNGSGKSTLLKLIVRDIIPDSGSVSQGLSAVLCSQELGGLPSFFSDPDLINLPETLEMTSRLEIGDDWPWRWETLSGGEKKRCIIADALVRHPDILILDEPANHMDVRTLELVAAELRRFSGIGIVVSHDLAFLDSLCTRTILLRPSGESTGILSYPVHPSSALEQQTLRVHAMRGRQQALGSEISRLTEIRDGKQRALHQDRKKLSKRNIDPRDRSAKAKVDGARLSGKDRGAGDELARMSSRIARIAGEADRLSAVPGERKSGVGLKGRRENRPFIVSVPAGILEVGGGVEILHPELTVRPDDRIVLYGDNGSGKTSLLRHLVDSSAISPASLWYIPQEISPEEREKLGRRLRDMEPEERGHVLSLVYRLGSEPRSVLSSPVPSPGESRKILFGMAMLEGVSAVFLDEPTNHLDVEAVQSWADALGEFSGAVVIVTHDRSFAARIARRVWHMEKKGSSCVMSEKSPDILMRSVLADNTSTAKPHGEEGEQS